MNKNLKDISKIINNIYSKESRRIHATLIRLLGDFDMAEDAMHDAFGVAMQQWQKEGVPSNPRAWLISTGRFKAIDTLRRGSRFDSYANQLNENAELYTDSSVFPDDNDVQDDELRLIFTCCHPALPEDARIALTLREVCGLTTEEIAAAFLTTAPTLAQRIVRAKAKIRESRIPFEMPAQQELPARINSVLHIIYLVFNEGYSATSGESLTRPGLSAEAIRLGRLMDKLLPDPEVKGLLALMLLQESRREARVSKTGDLVLLEEQDRSLWNKKLIREGITLVENALLTHNFGTYTLQAAIAAVHSEAAQASQTDWPQIVKLYDALLRMGYSPVVKLNRAVAVAMSEGPQKGLDLIKIIESQKELKDYYLFHSAKADLYRRLGKYNEARVSYKKALSLARQQTVKRFLQNRLDKLP